MGSGTTGFRFTAFSTADMFCLGFWGFGFIYSWHVLLVGMNVVKRYGANKSKMRPPLMIVSWHVPRGFVCYSWVGGIGGRAYWQRMIPTLGCVRITQEEMMCIKAGTLIKSISPA